MTYWVQVVGSEHENANATANTHGGHNDAMEHVEEMWLWPNRMNEPNAQ